MAKRKVRIYKAPQGKGQHRSKLKNFLFIAQQGAQVNQQQAMMDKVLSYVYDAIINQEEDPEDVYESLLKMKLDKNMASDVIEYVLQGIQNEGAARETVSRPTSKEEQAEQAFAAEEARREEEDETLMSQIMMDEGPDLQDPELEEQLFFSDEEELPQQQNGGMGRETTSKEGEELANKRGYELASIEADYWNDDTRNEPITSIFDPRYRKYRGINKYNKDIKKHNRFIDKAHDAYDDRWSVVNNYTDSTEWMKSPQYLNFIKYSEDPILKDLKRQKGTSGHKFKDKKINKAWGDTDWDAQKRDQIANYTKKLPRNRTYTTDEKLNEYLEWAKQKDPEYFKKNNIEKLLSNQKKSDRFNNQVLRSIIADQGLMPEPEKEVIKEEVIQEAPIMNEVVIDSPVAPQEEFVYEPTVIPEIPTMDLDPQVIPLEMQQFEMGDMDVDFDDVRSYNPRELRRKRRQDGRQKRSKTPRVIVDRGRRRSGRRQWRFQDAGEVTNYPAPPWPFGFTVPNKNEPTWEDMQEMVPKNVKDTLSNIENKLTDSKGNLMNVKQYVKKHLKGFQPGGAQGTTQNDENSPWTINQETWKRNDKTKALVNYSQNNVAKEKEKKRLEQEHAQLMAQREQLGNFIPQGGEEMIDMRSMQQQLPQAQYGGMSARRARRMIPRGFGISPLNVKNIDVRRTGLFGRPKEYSMEIAPFDYALLAANPLLRSIYNIDALTPSVITGKKTIIDYQPIKKAIKEIENKEKEKEDTEEDTEEVIENTEETEEIEETNGSEEVIEEEGKLIEVENQPNVKARVNEKGQVEDIIVTEDKGIDYDEDPTKGMSLEDITTNMNDPQIRNQYLNYLKESTGKVMPFDFPGVDKITEFMMWQERQRKKAEQDKINQMYNVSNVYDAPTVSDNFQTVPDWSNFGSDGGGWTTDEEHQKIFGFAYGGAMNNDDIYQAGGVPVWGMEPVQEDKKGAVAKAVKEAKKAAVWKEALKKAKEMAEQSREMQNGGIPMAQRGQRFIRRDRRNSNRDQRQQARGRRRDFRRANRVLRNQMRFPTLTGPRGMNHVFSANPAFGYAGSWSKPVSGFYNKRTNTPWQGQLSPDARIKSVDVTKSGIFGRPKRYSITYGQKTGDLVKKQQTPMITMNNNNQSNTSNASRANQAAMVANNNQNNPVDPRFNISQATVSNLDTTPLEYGSPIEWANKAPQTMREEYESQGMEMPSSLLSQAEKVWNPITNDWEGEAVEVDPELLPPPGYSDEMGVTINVDRPNNLNPETEEEVNYGPDGGGFVDEQPAWAEGADDYNDDYDWDEEEEEPGNEMEFIDGETPEVNSGDGDYDSDGGGFVTEQPEWAKDVYPSFVSSNVSPLGLMEQGVNAAMEYYKDNPGIYGPDGGGFVDEQPDWAKENNNFQYGGCPTCPKYNFGGMTLGDEIMMSEDQIAAYMRAGGVIEFI